MTRLTYAYAYAFAFAAISALTALYAAPPPVDAAPAQAAAPTKVWVANTGVDNASCGAVTAPCATFQQAHDNVAAGGDIGVLNAGDYRPINITKSVNITNDGAGETSILVPANTAGVRIQAGIGDVVGLRGLVIDGQGIGQNGIQIMQ